MANNRHITLEYIFAAPSPMPYLKPATEADILRDMIPTPTLIGYFPKRTSMRPEWLQAPTVEEICSVSTCVSKGPHDWIKPWRHNAAWVFDSPDLAWSVVPKEVRREFDLYAYRMYPLKFVHGIEESYEIPQVATQSLKGDFKALGFDAVSRSLNTDFECSPLSCNNMATEIAVNKCCLLPDAEEALKVAREFSVCEPEPGPYYVVEVLRREPR